jgi:SAM-dependent methyltransferase
MTPGGFEATLRRPTLDSDDPDPSSATAAVLTMARYRHRLVQADGRSQTLPVRRWHGAPEPAVEAVAARCAGPAIDLGCGPGRLTVALAQRGLVALGVDICTEAVRLTRARGAAALRRDVFDPLPGEGRWAHALLIDGNIGIGGDPVRLLRRSAALVSADGTLLVEVEPPGAGLWRGRAQVVSGIPGRTPQRGPSLRWARVGVDALAATATMAGLRVTDIFRCGPRWFGELVHA